MQKRSKTKLFITGKSSSIKNRYYLVNYFLVNRLNSDSIFKRLFTHTFFFGLGSVLPKAISFVLVPVYTIFLTPTDFGVVEMCSTLGGFIVLVMRLGIPGSVTRFYFDYFEDSILIKDYVTTVYRFLLLTSLFFLVFFGLVLFFLGDFLTPGVLFFPFIILVLINSALTFSQDLQRRLLQAREQSKYAAKINVAVSCINIGLTFLLVVILKLGALGMVLALIFTNIIFLIQAQFYLIKDLKGIFRVELLKSSLKYGIGMLPHHLFSALAPLLAKSLLVGTSSLSALGVYSLAIKLVLPLDVLYNSFNQGFQPIYFQIRKKIDMGLMSIKDLTDLFDRIWILSILLYGCLIFIMPWFVLYFIPSNYHKAISLIPIIALGFLGQVLYMLQATDLFYTKRTSLVPIVTGSGFIVNIIISVLLVKNYGAVGVAIANSAGFISCAFISFVLTDKTINFKSPYFISSLLLIFTLFMVNRWLLIEEIVYRSLVSLILLCFSVFILSRKNIFGNIR